jgi:parallel beta-helix repeat protein
MSPKLKVRKLMNLKSVFLACIVLISIGYSSLANAASIALNSSNWQGTAGAHYWDIGQPGTYHLDVVSPFVTTHSFAIKLSASNIILDGRGKTISGSSIPNSDNNAPPPDGTPDKYGVRANAGLSSSGINVKNLNIEKKYYGVIFEAVSSGRIENITANNNQFGIYLWDGDYNTITGNTTSENLSSGIAFDADQCVNSYNTISNNTASNNGEFGILLWLPCPNSTLTGNIANNNGNSAIALTSGCDNSSITENTAGYNTNGIHIQSSNNSIVANTLTFNTNVGLWLQNSNSNSVSDNIAADNQVAGIWLTSSGTNSLINNTCDSNLGHGIVLDSISSNNPLTGNATSSNADIGVVIQSLATGNTISGHTANNNSNGMRILNSDSNSVTNSTLTGNANNGLWVESSSGTSITGNTITNSQNAGVLLISSNGSTVSGNDINSHTFWGIFLSNSSNQTIFNNRFSNPSGNAGFEGSCSNNTWNTQKALGNNVVGGPYLGGNFWGNPNGTGFSQVTADNDGDGICDSSFTLSSGDVDALPLHAYSSQIVCYVNPNDNTCNNLSPCYNTIQDAINASTSGMTVKVVAGSYAENFVLNESIDIFLEGGWNSTFSTQTSKTTIIKPPTINQGSITFKEMLIKP